MMLSIVVARSGCTPALELSLAVAGTLATLAHAGALLLELLLPLVHGASLRALAVVLAARGSSV